jgi:hypothetical protein
MFEILPCPWENRDPPNQLVGAIGENCTKTHGKPMKAIDIQFLNQLQKDTKGSFLTIIYNALYPFTQPPQFL